MNMSPLHLQSRLSLCSILCAMALATAAGSSPAAAASAENAAPPPTDHELLETRTLAPTPQNNPGGNQEQEQAIEEVVITGSRIRRDAFTANTTLTVLSKDDILDTGLTDLSEVLEQIPSVVTEINPTSSQSSIQNAGISSVQLRGLGANRTLTLVDGRRMVSNSANAYRIDQSTLPSALIERIEVVTGAASPVYGSGAISGVVNYITENDFTGLEIEGRMGPVSLDVPGGERLDLRAAWGTFFEDRRGYMMVAATWDERRAIWARDHERFLYEIDFDWQCSTTNPTATCRNEFESYDPEDGNGGADRDAARFLGPNADLNWPGNLRDRSTATPGGYFDGGDFWYAEDGTLVCLTDTDTGKCNNNSDNNSMGANIERNDEWRYSWRKDNLIYIPRDRTNLSVKLNYELGDGLMLRNTLMYSHNKSVSTRSAETLYEDDNIYMVDPVTGAETLTITGDIPADNPFKPENADAGSIDFATRRFEIGSQRSTRQTDVYRLMSVLQGDMSMGAHLWDWEASLSWGRTSLDNQRANEVNLLNLQHGLRVEADPDNPGGYRCKDADARADGCVPVNLFGVNTVSPQAADYLRAVLHLQADVEQTTAQFFTTGTLGQLPAGAMQAVLGVEWRRDSQNSVNDHFSRFGGTTAPVVPNLDASIDTSEIFGELDVPIMENAPGADYLGLLLSARLSDYSLDNVDLVADVSLGLSWRPTHNLLVRVNRGTASRAPDLNEAFSLERGDFDNFDDPCNEVSATGDSELGDPVVTANCRTIPEIAAAIAADPQYEFEDNNSGYSPNAGNPDVHEETADTTTIGISWTPLTGLDLAVDWYDININDAIVSYSNEDILFQCYADNSGGFYDNRAGVTAPEGVNPRCLEVQRGSDGNISKIIQRQFNLEALRATGMELALRWDFSARALSLPGRMSLRYRHNYQMRNELVSNLFDGSTLVDDYLGEVETPEHRGRMRLSWLPGGDWRITWTAHHLGEVVDTNARLASYRTAQANFAAAGAEPPVEPLYLFFGSRTIHDISVRWRQRLPGGGSIRWAGGLYNLFDKENPIFPSPGEAGGRQAMAATIPRGPGHPRRRRNRATGQAAVPVLPQLCGSRPVGALAT